VHQNHLQEMFMNKFTKTIAAAALAVAMTACGTSPSMSDVDASTKMSAALAGDHRSEANKVRDASRHPAETLAFFDVTPDKTVMEIWPGGGWYTEVLAPYLRDSGTYIAAGWDPDAEMAFIKNAVAQYNEKLAANAAVYDQVQVAVLMPPMKLAPVEPGSVDVIVTMRSVHNWMPRDSQTMMLQAMYNSLKPGGILGVVEHRGNPNVPQDPKAKSGYVNEAAAIEMVEAVGFKLAGKSEINANEADTKDHPEGVWTLPPTLRLKDQDQAKYLAIGESDRFTLKFVKPEA
jgi:predicted methyltransferase